MAFDITNTVYTLPLQGAIGTPAARQTFTDQTATTSAVDLGAAYKYFRCYGYITAYVPGTATLGPIIEVQLGVTNFATLTTVATYQGNNIDATTAKQTFLIEGAYPLVAGAQYLKLVVTLSGNATISFDAVVDCF